jgi:hypothetical protein
MRFHDEEYESGESDENDANCRTISMKDMEKPCFI